MHTRLSTTYNVLFCSPLYTHTFFRSRMSQMQYLTGEQHSMNVIAMSATCVWVLVVGGWKSTSSDYASPVVALMEMSE